MKSPRRIDLYLQDMVTSMERILQYTEGLDFKSFQENFLISDAVARNFEIIGEASKRIPKSIQAKYTNVPWSKMYQLRNIVSHAYFSIDHDTIWVIMKDHLPQNLKDLKEVLRQERDAS